MLASTIAVVLGDYLQDQRRLDADRHLAYRDFLTAAREFENDALRKTASAIQDHIGAIRSYRNDSNEASQVSSMLATQANEFENIWQAWGKLTEKYEDVRLQGSIASIECAARVMDSADGQWRYLIGIANLIAGDQRKVPVTAKIKNFELRDFQDDPSSKTYWSSYGACQAVLESAP